MAQVLPASSGGAGSVALVALTADEQFFLDQSVQVLASECMKKQGLAYQPTATQQRGAQSNGDPTADQLRQGYQISKSAKETNLKDVNAERLNALTGDQRQAWDAAFFGDPSKRVAVTFPDGSTISDGGNGCLADARAQIYGSVPASLVSDHAPAFLVGDKARNALMQRSDYRSVVTNWQQCLARKGVDVSPQADIGLDEALRQYGLLPRAEADAYAARLAPADAACQRATGIHELRARLLQENATTLKSSSGLDAAGVILLRRQSVERARAIVLAGGTTATTP
ncbi:hypothetical protein BJY21_003198 [Kineosphaera limosa]|uniref:hypothetical protein n=1 Tax=Kineosphaera limosa TaxID=111564 RepID=UPI0012FBA4E7|nr:hypothetical protein [Kineosphaera limosa]NYE02014.1 hypothetical protein [Kineosphaera limosa]